MAGRLLGRLNVAGWLLVALVVAAFELAVRLFDLRDIVAAPSDAFAALAEGLWSGTLSGELARTLATYTAGLALAVVVGVGLGVVLGSSHTLDEAFSVIVEVLRPIPAVAIIPLAILVFGLGPPMLRFVIAYAAVWPILINTIYGVRGGDRLHDDVARTAGVTGLRRLVRVTLPGALPSIATGIRVSASIALLVCVTAEFLAASDGLGAYMQRQQSAFQLPELYAAVILVGLVGYLVNLLLRVAQSRIVFWVGEERLRSR